jgi:hypothetical protein
MLDRFKAVAKRSDRAELYGHNSLETTMRYLGAGGRRPWQVGRGEDPFVVKDEHGAAEGSGTRDGNTSKGRPVRSSVGADTLAAKTIS